MSGGIGGSITLVSGRGGSAYSDWEPPATTWFDRVLSWFGLLRWSVAQKWGARCAHATFDARQRAGDADYRATKAMRQAEHKYNCLTQRLVAIAEADQNGEVPEIPLATAMMWQEWIAWHKEKTERFRKAGNYIPPYISLQEDQKDLLGRLAKVAGRETLRLVATDIRRKLNLPEAPAEMTPMEDMFDGGF